MHLNICVCVEFSYPADRRADDGLHGGGDVDGESRVERQAFLGLLRF